MMIASLLMALQAAPADPFARARADAGKYCIATRPAAEVAACTKRQRSELGYFVTTLAGFDKKAAAGACMKSAKRGSYIDWTIATPCMRKATKGRALGN